MLDDIIEALGKDIADRQEQLVMQALAENGYKVTHPRTIAKRMKIQVDIANKNKRFLMDGKLILVVSTDYKIENVDGEIKANFAYIIIK